MRRLLSVLAIVAITACSHGSSNPPVPKVVPTVNPGGQTATVALNLSFGVPTVPLGKVRAKDVSPNTAGIGVVVYYHSDTTHANPIATFAYDVTPSSSLCTSQPSGARMCVLAFPAPVSGNGVSDDLVITAYNAAPPSGGASIPASATALDVGQITVTPVLGKTISPMITFEGVLDTAVVTVANPYSAYDANLYGALPYAVSLAVSDPSGAQIIGNAAYATPFTLSASGGTTTLTVNNSPGNTVRAPSDVIMMTDTPTAATASVTVGAQSGAIIATPATAGVLAAGTLGVQPLSGGSTPTYVTNGADNLLYTANAATPNIGFFNPLTPTALAGAFNVNGDSIGPLISTGNGATGAIYALDFGVGATASIVLESSQGTTSSASATVVASSIGDLATSGGKVYEAVGDFGSTTGTVAEGISPQYSQVFNGLMFEGIAVGSDGNLWVTWMGSPSNGISKLSPTCLQSASCSLTSYTSGLNSGSVPERVLSGPDGALWFADDGSTGAIGRIDTSGNVTEYALPGGAAINDIAFGPDGNLWITDFGTPSIIRFALATHTFTEFLAGQVSFPAGITAGPDGKIWYTDNANGTFNAVVP